MLKLTGLPADPFWRIQNFYLIRDKDKNRVRPKFKPSQERIYECIRERVRLGLPVRHYDLKCRQSMVTTFWMLFYLDDSIFNQNTRSAILAQKQDTLKIIWEAARFAHASMPSAIQPELIQDSANVLAFKGKDGQTTGSSIRVSLKVQGGTLNNLHVSEYPLCDPNDIRQTIAACPPNANITLEGVAEGPNHAYEKWVQVGDDYSRMFHPWFLQKEYRLPVDKPIIRTLEEDRISALALKDYGIVLDDGQIAYRRRAVKDLQNLAPQEMAEDAETCFISTGGAFFNGKKMRTLYRESGEAAEKEPPIESEPDDKSETGRLLVLEKPTHKCLYAAGADVAEGIDTGGDKDYSVLCILCVTHRRVAYRYRARVAVDTFYRHCDKICREYNRALLAPEINGTYGGSIITGLKDVCKYPNLFWRVKGQRAKGLNGGQKVFGWETTESTKEPALTQLRLALEGKSEEDENNFSPEFLVLDRDFLEETLYVIQDGAKIEAGKGHHDDLVMAYAIAHQMYRILKGSSRGPTDYWFWGSLESAEHQRGREEAI